MRPEHVALPHEPTILLLFQDFCFQSRQSFIKSWQQWMSGCQGFRWGDHKDGQPGSRRFHIIFSFLWQSTPQPGDMLGLRARKVWVLKKVAPEKAGHNLLAIVLGESREILYSEKDWYRGPIPLSQKQCRDWQMVRRSTKQRGDKWHVLEQQKLHCDCCCDSFV